MHRAACLGLGSLLAIGCAGTPGQTRAGRAEVARPAWSAPAVPIRDRYAHARIDLLAAINRDRAAVDLPPVRLDSLATVVAQAQAQGMVAAGVLSHYDARGRAPYERLAEAGGTAHVRENVFRWQQTTALDPTTDDPWSRFDPLVAETWLMGSPGHRAAILDPHREAVGLGFAVDPDRGAVYVVQDLIAAAVEIEAPRLVLAGQATPVSGRVTDRGDRPLLLVLHEEPGTRPWVARGDPPPGGPYADGGETRAVIAPWRIRWNPADGSFSVPLAVPRRSTGSRWYGVLYVAPDAVVREALSERRAETADGWPAAAFVLEIL